MICVTALKQTSPEHVTVCLEDGEEIRDNAHKLMSPQAMKAAQAAGRATVAPAVDVSAADFDED